MTEPSYKEFLREVVGFIVDKTKDETLYGEGDVHSAGYRLAIYSVLHMVENEAIAWNLSSTDVGLDSFSPDRWLSEGASYWKTR